MNKNIFLMMLFFNAIFVHVAYSADDFSQETGLLQTADGSNLFDEAESKPATKNIFSMSRERSLFGIGNKAKMQNQVYNIGMERLGSQECIGFVDINKVLNGTGRDQEVVFTIVCNELSPRLKTKDDLLYDAYEFSRVNSLSDVDWSGLSIYREYYDLDSHGDAIGSIKYEKIEEGLEVISQRVEIIFLSSTAIEGSYPLYHALKDKFPNLRYVGVSKGVSWSTAGL